MNDFPHRLRSLGFLHDTEITAVRFEPGMAMLRLSIDDLHANFVGVPDDPGRCAGEIALQGVTAVSFTVEPFDGHLRIDEFRAEGQLDGTIEALVALWPGGRHPGRLRDGRNFRRAGGRVNAVLGTIAAFACTARHVILGAYDSESALLRTYRVDRP